MDNTPASYIACRTLGHAWDSIPVPLHESRAHGGGLVLMWLRCTRCTTERHDLVLPFNGHVEARSYVYPDAYHRTRDDVMSRDEWRLSFLRISGLLPKQQRRKQSA